MNIKNFAKFSAKKKRLHKKLKKNCSATSRGNTKRLR